MDPIHPNMSQPIYLDSPNMSQPNYPDTLNSDFSSPVSFSQYHRPQQPTTMVGNFSQPPTIMFGNLPQQPTTMFGNSNYQQGSFHSSGPTDDNPSLFRPFPTRETSIPPFSTQDGLESIDPDISVINTPKRKKGESWSNDEEELLMSAWITISNDSVTGNGQQGKDFWRRITQYYNDFRKSFPSRTQTKVKGHWYQLLPSINEFNQIFINIERQYHSGWSDDQIKDATRKEYYSRNKKSFKYEHAWAIIKDEPKWKGMVVDDVHTKRRNTTSSGSNTSSDARTSVNVEDDETDVRPMGTKRAKRKQKEIAVTSNAEMKGMQDLINKTTTLRMSRIDEVNENIKELKESFNRSKRFEEIRILSQSTEGMTNEQLAYHKMLCDETKARYGI